ncbi:MAG: phosphoenolpyruvate--protein phosphotransferase, partial [Chloroflexota bacterium]
TTLYPHSSQSSSQVETAVYVEISKDTPTSDFFIRGIAAASGIAIGPICQFEKAEITIRDETLTPDQEKQQLELALNKAKEELEALQTQTKQRIGAEEAAIFEAHLEILEDADLLEATYNQIDAGHNAGRAWQGSIDTTATQLASLSNELLAARATDIRDVGQRVLRLLQEETDSPSSQTFTGPVILIAEDLTPSDTVTLDPAYVLGFCTAIGGVNAHTAILARALGIPALVGAGMDILQLKNDTPAILDGTAGTLHLNPDQQTLDQAKRQFQSQKAAKAADLKNAHEPAITQDQHQVEVVANIGSVAEASQAVDSGAEGVGLLRTEFLFLDRAEAPTEAEQYEIYRDILLGLQGNPAIMRTLDIGGDKPLPYLDVPAEENPFLGERGIRLTLSRSNLLRVQIRAILQAAKVGPCRIMFPMVTNLGEWHAAKKVVEEELAAFEGAPPKVELGIMIEVPAAALLADKFAAEVDFFSIGTNDLTQYTLAIDRTHPTLSAQADGLHPSVLRLIDRTVQAAHAAGKWVGVCGELGGDPLAVPILVGLGVDELSANIPAIPAVKAQIRGLTLSKLKQTAAQALDSSTAEEVRSLAEKLLQQVSSGD